MNLRIATVFLMLLPGAGVLAQMPFQLTPERATNSMRLHWPSRLGENFQLEFRTNCLPITPWQPVVINWPAISDSKTSFTHPNALSASAGFYRVGRQPFTFNWTGTNFTYTDAVRSFTGIMLKPAGSGPFPAVVINHGAGGTANGYSLSKARELSAWGMVCIGPTLTHVAGGETNSWNMGFCPENLTRIAVCLNVLGTLPYVDTNRLALFGHSMGAFATVGSSAQLNSRLRTAVISAGGAIPDGGGTNNATPTATEASPVRIPFLMFHCDGDPVVPLARSDLFLQILNTNFVLNQRILYSSNSIPNQSNWHNIHQDNAVNADILTNTFQWFQARGMLP